MSSSCAMYPEWEWNSLPGVSVTRYRRDLLSSSRTISPAASRDSLTVTTPSERDRLSASGALDQPAERADVPRAGRSATLTEAERFTRLLGVVGEPVGGTSEEPEV